MQFDHTGDALQQLFDIITTLRGPGGCPWDQKRKFEDVASDLIEETYELQWALANQSAAEVRDELGDLLFLICFAISIRRESDPAFSLDHIAGHAWQKIYSRHPHVFGDAKASTPEESIAHWERVKAVERGTDHGALSGVPGNLPALRRAEKVQERAAAAGFDWDRVEDVVAKLREETDELEQAVAGGNRDEIQHEIGDLFFSLVNVARYLGNDSERALAETTSRFMRRFETMEKLIGDDGQQLSGLSLKEMDTYWERAKSIA